MKLFFTRAALFAFLLCVCVLPMREGTAAGSEPDAPPVSGVRHIASAKAGKSQIMTPRLTAAARNGKSVLTWSKSSKAEGYILLRKTKRGTAFRKYKKTRRLVCLDRDVRPGHTYFYQIYAYGRDAQGARVLSKRSGHVTVTIPRKPTSLTIRKVTDERAVLRWRKVTGAVFYQIYRKTKGSDYQLIRTRVRTNTYTDHKLDDDTVYRYRVRAVGKSTIGFRFETAYSRSVRIQTKKRVLRTAYVGDSVMSGLGEYHIVTEKNRKVISKIGVSPYTFYNNVIMDQLLDYRPDRMFVMIGMNAIEGDPSHAQLETVLRYYRLILEECRQENPDIQIIVLPVSPTRPGASAHNSVIERFNRMVQEMAKDMGLLYYDYTFAIKGNDGALSADYAERDGIHWKISGYRAFKDALDDFEKQL